MEAPECFEAESGSGTARSSLTCGEAVTIRVVCLCADSPERATMPTPACSPAANLSRPMLDSYLGKNISEICPHGFDDADLNHCAHFVCHVMNVSAGSVTCSKMSSKRVADRIGACIRCMSCLRLARWWESTMRRRPHRNCRPEPSATISPVFLPPWAMAGTCSAPAASPHPAPPAASCGSSTSTTKTNGPGVSPFDSIGADGRSLPAWSV